MPHRRWPATAASGSGPWASADFRRLWVAEVLSQTGSQISVLALPLVAIVVLGAGPAGVGILAAAGTAPVILFGLPAGVWLDRHRRKPVLVAADIGRAVALATVPVAYGLDLLSLPLVCGVTFVCGALTVVADVAAQAFLPSLLPRRDLAQGNANLELARAGAQTAGPGISGVLVSLIGGPLAVVGDAISYVCSAACISRTGGDEPPVAAPVDHLRASAWARARTDMADGLRYVGSHQILRPIAVCSAVSNFGSSMVAAVVVLFMIRTLELGPGVIGLLLAVGNLGLIVGSALVTRLVRRFGPGPVIIGSLGLGSPFTLLVPLAPEAYAIPALVIALLAAGARSPIYNVAQISLRQAITPPELHGRMTATMRMLVLSAMPVGALLGGLVATHSGLRPALLAGALLGCTAFVFPLLSPVRSLTTIPDEVDPTTIHAGLVLPNVTPGAR
ncbi:MAG TPA: MFS transporter [Acidimicrobiales bacterium]|nr:MFS transporter [Acidimicrobiales bacterium]